MHIAQLHQLFKFLQLDHICGHGFNELSRMLMRKNVNNEVSNDVPQRGLLKKVLYIIIIIIFDRKGTPFIYAH